MSNDRKYRNLLNALAIWRQINPVERKAKNNFPYGIDPIHYD